MTWKDLKKLAHSNAVFIEGIPDTFMRTVYAAQLTLYSLCLDKLVDKLETENGEISNNSKNRKLIAAFSIIYETFRIDEIQPIVNEMVDNISEITQNNIDYYHSLFSFSEQFKDSDNLDTFNSNDAFKVSQDLPITDVHQTINFRLGITEAGAIVSAGFLFNLYHDKSVVTEIQQSVYKGMITGSPITDLKDSLKSDIVGETEMIPDESGNKIEKVTKNGMLGRVFSPVANDVFTQVDRTASTVISNAIDLKYFIYSGTVRKNSRAFCIPKCNKVFSTDDAKEWINEDPGPIAVDKDTYDPILQCGGINCYHICMFITDELYKVLKDQDSDLIPA